MLNQTHRNPGTELNYVIQVSPFDFAHIGEDHPFALAINLVPSRVVQTQHDVLGRHNRRFAVGREQHVVRGQHQGPSLELRLERQRHVYGHLVAVKVGIERGTNERVELYRLALDQLRLKGLDAEAVECRRPVEQNRMLANHVFKDVPDDRFLVFNKLLRGLDRSRDAHGFELVKNERLEKLQRHQLGQAALMQFELRSDHNHRTTRVVDPLAQQVLAEAPALALDHVSQRLERTLVGARHGLTATTVIEQRIDRFLEHALLIAHDNFGRLELEQPLQAIVTVNHATIKIV